MGERKTCFFLGHRVAGEWVYPALCEAVERHIREYGVRDFVVGRYGSFDALAARAVREAKRRGEAVTLTLLLAYYRPQDVRPEGYDISFFPPGLELVPKRAAIAAANRYMLDHSTHLIAFVSGPGNSRDGLEYARRRARKTGIHIENLAERK